MRKSAYLFPGQGAQYVGMGKDFYENNPGAREVFDVAEEALPGIGIKKLCFEGPIEELTKTQNAQVAMLVSSAASLKAMELFLKKRSMDIKPDIYAGLSLGELTALIAAGSLNLRDGVRLVRRRGELMEDASRKNPGSMSSILGIELDVLKEACRATGAEVANLNCPGQIVISGPKKSVEDCMALSLEKGAKRAIPLNVSGGFHSSLMKEAAELFRLELDKVNFSDLAPGTGVISNVTADIEKTQGEIKENLVRQLYSPVRWEESVRKMASRGIDIFFEIGPGKVLKGLLRKIDPGLKVYNIEKPEDLEAIES